jgi:hypothetical protein
MKNAYPYFINSSETIKEIGMIVLKSRKYPALSAKIDQVQSLGNERASK